MSVTVVIPWRGGCPHREEARAWVTARYEAKGWPVRVSEHADGAWCKPAAIVAAARALPPGGTLVLADGDVWCDGISEAVDMVTSGQAPWAVPHHHVHRLTPAATRLALDGRAYDLNDCVRAPYKGTAAGGLLVIGRDTILDVPPDQRFAGWGGADPAWRDALRCLVGMAWRGTRPLVHLWHPPQPRTVRHGSEANARLVALYAAARHDPGAMRALIAEAPE